MAGFLSDLGRSNAIQSINNLSNTAVQLKGLQNRDEQQGFENAINIEKLGMMKNEQEVDMRIKTAQAKEVEEKAKALTMPYDITVDPRFLALPPEAQKVVMDHAVKNKYTDQNGLGTRRSAYQLMSDVEGKTELFSAALGPVVEGRKKATTDAWSALQDAKVKGDPKKIQEAQAEFDKASLTYQSTQSGFSTHLSALEKERAKQEGKIEKGPGGGLYRRKEDGTLEELVAPPEKETPDKFGTVTTAEGVFSYDQRTGKPGTRIGSPKESADGSGTGAPKVGTVGQVGRSLIRRYLPIAKMNLQGNAEAPKILEGINISLGSTDQFGGSVNDARLYEALSPSQREGYDWVKAKAEEYSAKMSPEAAVDKAWKEGMAERKRQGAGKAAPTVSAPAGYATTGKMHNGKPLYFNPKAPKGKEYWTP
jgi:hypothetical protein